ncbi:hypothetical protein [Nocardia amamiensis]|uniref:hypothetical protein n=1 Tax=Nocardia amamiensis TaxID=404578 RepID=UPI00082A0A56|nr:hypothetical protein [Nocardia amamiensis]
MSSYFCAHRDSALLGYFDGVETWTVRTAEIATGDEQSVTELHENLHRRFQNSTPWGMLARLAADVARVGVDQTRMRRLARFCNASARTTHETYASYLSVRGDRDSVLIADDRLYRDYVDRGLAITQGREWSNARFLVDAVLRAAMAPITLLEADRPLSIRLSALATDSSPDARLETLTSIDWSAIDVSDLDDTTPRSRLWALYDEVATRCDDLGLPTMSAAESSAYGRKLNLDLIDTAPAVSARIDRYPIGSAAPPPVARFAEHGRDRIELHTQPHRLEVLDSSAIATSAKHFVRRHPGLGAHVWLTWTRSDALAHQFARPNALEAMDGSVVGLQALDLDIDGVPVVRLAIFDGVQNPNDVARILALRTLVVTTSSTSPDAIGRPEPAMLYIIMDTNPIAELSAILAADRRIRWMRLLVRGERFLHAVVFLTETIPNQVWIALTTGLHCRLIRDWLITLGEDKVHYDPTSFADHTAELDAVIAHVVNAWFEIELGQKRS